MAMLEALTVTGFRKYKRLSLAGLGRVNCVLGSNNVGKTTILEAVYAWACGANVKPLLSMRGSEGEVSGLFNDRHAETLTMTFDGVADGKRECFTHTVRGTWEVRHNDGTAQPEAFYPAKFIGRSPDTGIYTTLEDSCLTGEAVREVGRIFPEISGFSRDGIIRNDGEILPLSSFGDGVQKWFQVVGAAMTCRDSIICIDEADTGLHPSTHAGVCRNLIGYSHKNNLQIFMTTHNIEFLDSLIDTAEGAEDVKIITLREKGGNVSARTLNAKEAMNARDNFSMELR